MNQIMEFGKSISMIGGADGPTSVFVAGRSEIGITIAFIVIGILTACFGLKIVRLLTVITGLGIGLCAGGAIAYVADLEGTMFLAAVLAGGVIMALLSFFLYRFGVFCVAFLSCAAALLTAIRKISLPVMIVVAAVSLILAILAAIYVEPIVIVITAVCGGVSAGLMIAQAAGLEVWIGYAAGAGIAVAGLIVQFAMHSRKVGKKEKNYSEKVKEKVSVESEVEKARNILDDDKEEE